MITLPVLLVLVGLILKVTLLLHFVVVHVEWLSVQLQSGILAGGSSIRSLKANKSVRHLVVLLLEEAK